MIYQVTTDEQGYVTALSEGGYIEGGVDVAQEVMEAVDTEKIGAYRLDENGGLVFDPDRWAEMEAGQRLEALRHERERVCFPVINRGILWYETLDVGEYEALQGWYRAWLDAPQTGSAPRAPSFLKEGIGG